MSVSKYDVPLIEPEWNQSPLIEPEWGMKRTPLIEPEWNASPVFGHLAVAKFGSRAPLLEALW